MHVSEFVRLEAGPAAAPRSAAGRGVRRHLGLERGRRARAHRGAGRLEPAGHHRAGAVPRLHDAAAARQHRGRRGRCRRGARAELAGDPLRAARCGSGCGPRERGRSRHPPGYRAAARARAAPALGGLHDGGDGDDGAARGARECDARRLPDADAPLAAGPAAALQLGPRAGRGAAAAGRAVALRGPGEYHDAAERRLRAARLAHGQPDRGGAVLRRRRAAAARDARAGAHARARLRPRGGRGVARGRRAPARRGGRGGARPLRAVRRAGREPRAGVRPRGPPRSTASTSPRCRRRPSCWPTWPPSSRRGAARAVRPQPAASASGAPGRAPASSL